MNLFEELHKLKETKLSIYNALKASGADISQQTPFNEYSKYIHPQKYIERINELFVSGESNTIEIPNAVSVLSLSKWMVIKGTSVDIEENLGNERYGILYVNPNENSLYIVKVNQSSILGVSVKNITSFTDTTNTIYKNSFNCQYIEIPYKPKKGDKLVTDYTTFSENKSGVICGADSNCLYNGDKQIVFDKDSINNIFVFGENSDSQLPNNQIPTSIKFIKIFSGDRLIYDLVPFIKDNKYGLFDSVSRVFFHNKGTGEDFYCYENKQKESNIIPSFEELLK